MKPMRYTNRTGIPKNGWRTLEAIPKSLADILSQQNEVLDGMLWEYDGRDKEQHELGPWSDKPSFWQRWSRRRQYKRHKELEG